MASAFIGYVLPWGQMSFWGATVITNLLSAIPYIGDALVKWIWGGFSVNNATLNRFFSFHFILPLASIILVLTHIILLHSSGSSSPLRRNINIDKIPFHSYFTIKDIFIVMVIFWAYIFINFIYPYSLGDPENFMEANPMVTPVHIQPEWYLLFAYAILRSIPSKLGGVIALLISLLAFSLLSLSRKKLLMASYSLRYQFLFWRFLVSSILLTWLGACSIEYPYIVLRQIIRVVYFLFFILNLSLNKLSKAIGLIPQL